MKNRTNKPIKNFQKKKYYTNRNYVKKNFTPKDNKKYPDLDGTLGFSKAQGHFDKCSFAVDAKTFEVKYIPNK